MVETKRTVVAGVWQLFAIAASSLLLFSGLLLWDLQRVATVRATMPRSEGIERDLLALTQELRGAESGQRGCLLSQDEHYLTRDPVVAGRPSRTQPNLVSRT